MAARSGLIAVLAVALATLAGAPAAQAAQRTNLFAGQWATSTSGSAGSVTFSVIDNATGAASIQNIGGSPCADPTTYYHGDYDDGTGNKGIMTACTKSPTRLVGRYSAPAGKGGFDITYDASNDTFAGSYTADDFPGFTGPYSGTFVANVPGDGCCPSASGSPPVASFIVNPANASVGQTVTFDASASSDPDGDIATYEWAFGDGAVGAGKVTSHAYSSAFNYTIKLTVTDQGGRSDQTYRTVDVAGSAPPSPPPSSGGTPPTQTGQPTTGASQPLACGSRVLQGAWTAQAFCANPVTPTMKRRAREISHELILIYVVSCYEATNPKAANSHVCGLLSGLGLLFAKIADDPPDPRFGFVSVVAGSRPAGASAGRDGLARALGAYGRALGRVQAAAGGLETAANRFSSASGKQDAQATVNQSAAAKAFAGELTGALTSLRSPGRKLGAVLRRRLGADSFVSRATLKRAIAKGRRRTHSKETRRLLADAGKSLPRVVEIGEELGRGLPTAAFRASNNSITVTEVRALVDQLGKQKAIPAQAQTILTTDLDGVESAAGGAARERAISRLVKDADSTPSASAAALLVAAAKGLAG